MLGEDFSQRSGEGTTGKIESYHTIEQVISISGFERYLFLIKNKIKIANVFVIGQQVYLQNNKRSERFG